MMNKLLIFVIFLCSLNRVFAQEKIIIYCKINFYKDFSSDVPNKLNIVFDKAVRFAEFDDKDCIQKLKVFEETISAVDIKKYMSSLGWQLADSKNTEEIGYTFYFKKTLDKSSVDFVPHVRFKYLY